MPLNRGYIGKEFPEARVRVERDRVVLFADAIGDPTPAYRDGLAPPTFPTTFQIATGAQIVLDPDFGLDYTRVVHGEQEYEYRRPLAVGDELVAHPRIADIYAKGPNEFLVTEIEFTDPKGETVVTARSTLISRGTAEGR